MEKQLYDLEANELAEFLDYNEDIQSKVYDRLVNDTLYYIGEEYLSGIPDRDVEYYYDQYGCQEFIINEVSSEFMHWVESTQKAYGWFNAKTYENCQLAYQLYDKIQYENAPMSVYKRYDELKEQIGSDICDLINREFETINSEQYQIDTFDLYTEEFFDENPDEIYVDTDTWDWYVKGEDADNEF